MFSCLIGSIQCFPSTCKQLVYLRLPEYCLKYTFSESAIQAVAMKQMCKSRVTEFLNQGYSYLSPWSQNLTFAGVGKGNTAHDPAGQGKAKFPGLCKLILGVRKSMYQW